MNSIADYQGWHRGHECLLLGNGPSLLRAGVSPIADDLFVIGTNQSWAVLPLTDYHVIADQNQLNMPHSAETFHAMGVRLFSTIPLRGSVPMTLLPDLPGRTTFSRDLRSGVVLDKNGVGSVLYVALQLATWMGFSDIWICGFDMMGPKFTGEPARTERQNELFALTPPDVRARVRVIEPTACTAFETVPWPWRENRGEDRQMARA